MSNIVSKFFHSKLLSFGVRDTGRVALLHQIFFTHRTELVQFWFALTLNKTCSRA